MVLAFLSILIFIGYHFYINVHKVKTKELHQLKKYFKKKERKNRKKIRHMHHYYNHYLNLSNVDFNCDTSVATSKGSGLKDYFDRAYSSNKARKVRDNYFDKYDTTTLDKPSILKKYVSDTSTKKKDDRVRFQDYGRKDSEDDSLVKPVRLNFNDLDNDDPYNRYNCLEEPKFRNNRLMQNIERSLEKENKPFWGDWGIFKNENERNMEYSIRMDRMRREQPTRRIDLRCIDGEYEDSKRKILDKHSIHIGSNDYEARQGRPIETRCDLVDMY